LAYVRQRAASGRPAIPKRLIGKIETLPRPPTSASGRFRSQSPAEPAAASSGKTPNEPVPPSPLHCDHFLHVCRIYPLSTSATLARRCASRTLPPIGDSISFQLWESPRHSHKREWRHHGKGPLAPLDKRKDTPRGFRHNKRPQSQATQTPRRRSTRSQIAKQKRMVPVFNQRLRQRSWASDIETPLTPVFRNGFEVTVTC
jgi:hypothetical protein